MNDNKELASFPYERLKKWFLQNKRFFPWRENPSPYRVWISEVMLQQTQASVVVGFFENWMQKFPTIYHLAQADVAVVLKAWEGLGYYSRARSLHEGAKYLVAELDGKIPSDKTKLLKIKGIGPYTAGAILSFAFYQKQAAVDGNVLRLLSRFFALDDPIDSSKTFKKMEEITLKILPDEDSSVVMEGLIEFGATICKKKPECEKCLLQTYCKAFKTNRQKELPKKSREVHYIALQRDVALISHQNTFLVQKRDKGELMAGLYEFPYLERPLDGDIADFEQAFQIPLTYARSLSKVAQAFTRYRVTLFPHVFYAEGLFGNFEWKTLEEMQQLPFSSGHKKILHKILEL